MSKLFEFNRIFNREFREDLLRPSNVVFYSAIEAGFELQKGDHIVVFTGDVYHHGIYLGGTAVAHMVSTTTPALQETTTAKFVGNQDHIGIIRHHFMREEKNENDVLIQVIVDTASDVFRDETVRIARTLLTNAARRGEVFHPYNLITENCECFAWAVITRNLRATSQQISGGWNILMNDIDNHRNQFTQAHGMAIGIMIYDFILRVIRRCEFI